MNLKIKWNDDRVNAAATALLLIGRARLASGATGDVVAEALAEFRADPVSYKENRKTWPPVRELGPLQDPPHVARYQSLLADVDRLLAKWQQAKRQFTSLRELDNALIAHLGAKDSGAGQRPR